MEIGRGSRRSIRYCFFIGILAGSILSGSGAFAVDPTPIASQTDLEDISDDLAGDYVLTSNIALAMMESITNLAADSFTGTLDGAGFTISGLTKPLFNGLNGATISDLSLSGNVEVIYICGGGTCHSDEVGMLTRTSTNTDIDLLTTEGTVTGRDYVGGIAGWTTGGTITNSQSDVTVVGDDQVGGLVGRAIDSEINSSFSEGNVQATGGNVGGLVGLFTGSASSLSDSYATGDVEGFSNVGGVVGAINNSIEIDNVASTGVIEAVEIVGGIVGTADLCDSWGASSCDFPLGTLSNISSFGSVTATDHGAGSLIGVLWSGNIDNYRAIATVLDTDPNNDSDLSDTYSGAGIDKLFACDCSGVASPTYGAVLSGSIFDSAEYIGGVSGGSGGGDSPPVRLERAERLSRINIEAKPLEKIEKSLGFKNESLLIKDAVIEFIESSAKIELAKIKAVEVSVITNARVYAKTGEALQISLKSESKEPVELWVKSPDESWLLAGVITFDKDGKAILPPLQFKKAGDYTLVLNKPSADSAKGSAPLNQSGSVLVAVS